MHALNRIYADLSIRRHDSFHDRGHWSFDPRLHAKSIYRNKKLATSCSHSEQDRMAAKVLELELL